MTIGSGQPGHAPATAPPLARPDSVPVVCTALVVAGFVAIALAWRGAAATVAMPLQVPHLVSGGLAGLGLIIFGVGIAYVHLSRVAAAAETEAIDDINRSLAAAGVGIVVSPGRAPRRSEEPATGRRRRRTRRRPA